MVQPNKPAFFSIVSQRHTQRTDRHEILRFTTMSLCSINDIRLLTAWPPGCYSYHESEKYFEPALCCNGRADRQWVAKTACLREPMFVGLYSSLFRLLVASEGFFLSHYHFSNLSADRRLR